MPQDKKILEGLRTEFRRYQSLAERAAESTDEAARYSDPGGGNNSMAVLMQHVGGNLYSRFTAFLTEDGEKATRDRDGEFEQGRLSPPELRQCWDQGWQSLHETLEHLREEDMGHVVHIRGVAFTAAEALLRSLAHTSYHVGQIVTLARLHQGQAWRSLSIPRSGSDAYAKNPNLERGLPE